MHNIRMSYFKTEIELREKLKRKITGRTQSSVAAEIGVSKSFLSGALHKAPLTGKILKWLGYTKGPKVYVEE